MVRRIVGRSSLLGLLMLLVALRVFAQDNYTRVEIGAQYSTVRLTNSNLGGTDFSGFGGRFDWNLNRRLAFESQLDFFPENTPSLLTIQGGKTVQAVFGVRAKVIQTRRISVFGIIRPGFFHFTDVLYFNSNSATCFAQQPETHFVLNLGGGIEYYLNPRWVLRADLEGDPYRVPNSHVVFPGGTAFSVGKIDDTTRFSVGVAYRPGTLIENEKETNVPGK